MNYTAEISVHTENADDLILLFEAEQNRTQTRSEWEVQKDKSIVKFLFKSKDSVALRATMNSITKLLTVVEKMQQMKNGKRD